MNNDNCEELLSRVIDRLSTGDDLSDAELAHLKAFAACRDTLTTATKLEEDLMSSTIPEEAGEMSTKTVNAVQHDRHWRTIRSTLLAIGVIGALAMSATWWAFASFHHDYHADLGSIAALSIVIGLASGATFGRLLGRHKVSRRSGFELSLFFTGLMSLAYAVALGGIRLYVFHANIYRGAIGAMILLALGVGFMIGSDALPFKRLYRGRVLSGVLMGIAEEFGWRIFWVRLLFILAMWAVKSPWLFFAYLILDLFMQPHPDDRVHMWRFRIARWFRSRLAAAQ
jgi:phage shock protein PspC (stress-responsive transcriptional regulator)